MKANRTVKFMVTEEQFQRIKNKAVSKGFVTVSSFIRYLTLEQDLSMEDKLNKVYNKVFNE